MRVIDQDTGKEFNLYSTPEFQTDMDVFHEADCRHTETEVRRRIVAGGALQFVPQCVGCGASVGSAIRHADAPPLAEPWDVMSQDRYRSLRELNRCDIIQKHVRIQRAKEDGFWQRYNEYLKTDEWRRKRTKVFERSGGICEGCRERQATQVHHLTYKNVTREFLFELAAVCDECHSQIHAKELEIEKGADVIREWKDGFPCDGCRWGSEQGSRRWCGILDVLAVDALSPSGDCGPNHDVFDPLR
jgi:5-methylcytosine-specific restriction endonuclease McrA